MRWHLSKDTHFDAKNYSTVAHPEHQIHRKLCRTYKIPLFSSLASSIRNELYKYDFGNFYVGDSLGRKNKATTIIKKIISKKFKESVNQKYANWDKNFAGLGKEIAEIYSPEYKVKAFWGNKNLIGEGKYEGEPTCFASGADNESNRRFIITNRRFQVLVIQNDKGGKGRCLAYFPGGRNIFLFNFYTYKMNVRPIIWAETVKHIFNLSNIKYLIMNDEFDLDIPIYQNDGTLLIHDTKSFKIPKPQKFVCPSCQKFIPRRELFRDSEDNYIQCKSCQKIDRYTECDECGVEYPLSELVKIKTYMYCPNCLVTDDATD